MHATSETVYSGQAAHATGKLPRTPGPINEVKDAMDRASTLCSRVEALVDRLVGESPEDSAEGNVARPDGLFHELADKADYLNRRLASAERALERIERVAL